MRLTATTTPTDHQRALRLLIAWATGGKLALDVVLDDAMRDPTGTPGLIFAMAEFITEVGTQGTEDYVDQLRQLLLHEVTHTDEPGQADA